MGRPFVGVAEKVRSPMRRYRYPGYRIPSVFPGHGILARVTRRIHVIGVGAGDPDYVTAQAVDALNDTQVFFAMDKGEAKDELVALRRLICERFIREPGYRFVALPDPPEEKAKRKLRLVELDVCPGKSKRYHGRSRKCR